MIPVTLPPEFTLSQALERAISLDTNNVCLHVDDSQYKAGSIEGAWWIRSPTSKPSPGRSDSPSSSSSPDNVDFVGGSSSRCSGTTFAEDGAGFGRLEEGEIPGSESVESLPGGRIGLTRKQRYQQSQKVKRFKAYGHIPTPRNRHKHVGSSAPIAASVDLPNLPFTKCGYQAVNLPKSKREPVKTLAELKEEGYHVVTHIPRYVHSAP